MSVKFIYDDISPADEEAITGTVCQFCQTYPWTAACNVGTPRTGPPFECVYRLRSCRRSRCYAEFCKLLWLVMGTGLWAGDDQ